MLIETKYNIGDEVWYRHHANIIKGVIEYIELYANENIFVDYQVHSEYNSKSSFKWLQESQLYKSKEELIAHEAYKIKKQ